MFWRTSLTMLTTALLFSLSIAPAQADEDFLDEVSIYTISGLGDKIHTMNYSMDIGYEPDRFILTSTPPTKLWTVTKWYCPSGGEKVGPLFIQGQGGVWEKETELIPNEVGAASVWVETSETIASIFNAFDCDQVDTNIYPGVNEYGLLIETEITAVELEGEILRGAENPWANSAPAQRYFRSYVVIADDEPPGTGGCDVTFSDVPCDYVFHGDIEWLAESGITKGCNPPDNSLFCPSDFVTRGQMAAFLVRGLELPPRGYDEYATYVDVSSTHVFFDEVGILGAEGITKGCNPPDNDYFCPSDFVTRGQMAAFLVRALGLPASSADAFVDDDNSVFERDIQALSASGITRGCNPPDNDRFCPNEPVTRGQMAAFLHRALAP